MSVIDRSSPDPSRWRGYVFVIAAAVLWGTLGIFGKTLYAYRLDPVTVVFVRASLAFAVLLLLLLLFRPNLLRINRRDLPFFALYGFVSVGLFYAVYFYTIALTSVATAAVLLYTAPIFVAVLSRFLYRERFGLDKLAALALAFIGCVLVVKAYDLASLRLNLLSLATGLASGLSYGLYSIFGKRALQHYTPWTTLVYVLGFGSLFFFVVQLPIGMPTDLPSTAWLLFVLLALGPTLLSFALYTIGLGYLPPSRAAITATVEPVAAAIFAFLLLHEALEPWQIVGMILVLSGVVIVRLCREGQ